GRRCRGVRSSRRDLHTAHAAALAAGGTARAFIGDRSVACVGLVMAAVLVAVVDDVELFLGLGAALDALLAERLEPVLAILGVEELLLIGGLVEIAIGGLRLVHAVELAGVVGVLGVGVDRRLGWRVDLRDLFV